MIINFYPFWQLLNIEEILLLRNLYLLSPSIKMLSKSYDFQMKHFLTTDQHTENNALYAHCLPAVSPKSVICP